MPLYYDIHTHHQHSDDRVVFALINRSSDFAHIQAPCTLGLHPWYVQGTQQEWSALQSAAVAKDVLAIGECGLDKLCSTDWSLQLTYFEQQIELANQLSKPLIIHCVRAYEEVLHLLRKATVPVIFHGFNKSVQLANQLCAQNYYLSLGAAIAQADSPSSILVQSIPLSQLFLETDQQEKYSIQEIYTIASNLRGISLEELQMHIQNNFRFIFKQ